MKKKKKKGRHICFLESLPISQDSKIIFQSNSTVSSDCSVYIMRTIR